MLAIETREVIDDASDWTIADGGRRSALDSSKRGLAFENAEREQSHSQVRHTKSSLLTATLAKVVLWRLSHGHAGYCAWSI